MKALLPFAILLLVSSVSVADVLKLSGDRELEGSVQELLFLVDGKQQKFDRDGISRLQMSPVLNDELTLKDGSRVSGTLVSIVLKSVGGALSFRRDEVIELTLKADPLVDARKELALKRAQIKSDDAEGLSQLAKWCEVKGLKAEAAELAKASLQAAGRGKGGEAKENPQNGLNPGGEKKGPTVDDFRSAIKKCDAIEKLLEKKGLVVVLREDAVAQITECPDCKGSGLFPPAERIRCRQCSGRGSVVVRTPGIPGGAGTLHEEKCRACDGKGYAVWHKGEVCRSCAGTGKVRRVLGTIADFAVAEPLVPDYQKAVKAKTDTATAVLRDEKIKKLPADVWTAAMEMGGTGFGIVPEEKGLVLAPASVRSVVPQEHTTILILDLSGGGGALITVGWKVKPRDYYTPFWIRGTVTGKKGDFLVIEDYQTHPDVAEIVGPPEK